MFPLAGWLIGFPSILCKIRRNRRAAILPAIEKIAKFPFAPCLLPPCLFATLPFCHPAFLPPCLLPPCPFVTLSEAKGLTAQGGILRFAQNDRVLAQNDRQFAQNDRHLPTMADRGSNFAIFSGNRAGVASCHAGAWLPFLSGKADWADVCQHDYKFVRRLRKLLY